MQSKLRSKVTVIKWEREGSTSHEKKEGEIMLATHSMREHGGAARGDISRAADSGLGGRLKENVLKRELEEKS